MKKTVYEVDTDGFIIEIERYVEDTETTSFVTVDLPNGLYKPKFIVDGWIEGATQAEITNKLIPLSEKEQFRLETARSNAEMFEIMISLLESGI